MAYWTPMKAIKTPRICSVCGKLFKNGWINIQGVFFCEADRNVKDYNDLNINRISIWKREDVPLVIVSQIVQFAAYDWNATWFVLVPLELVTQVEAFLYNFDVVGEVSTTYGQIYGVRMR